MFIPQVEEQVSLKLVINKDTNKVLFAEAGKDFVDLLCSFLTFPLGTIARLMGQSTDSSCLNSLYRGAANLDKECLWTPTCREMLLQPRNFSEDFCRSLKLNIDDTEPTKYLLSWNLHEDKCWWLSTFKNIKCPCGKYLSRSVPLKWGNVDCDGFVKGGATYIITDDLVVKPNSMETSFGIIQAFGIKNTSSVNHMTVNVTKNKVIDLLKFSLFSKSALTDLFLKKKPLLPPAIFSPSSVVNNNNTNGYKIMVKLFMRKSDGKILFAQGEEDFADFIFSFLTFPLGGVVRMLGGYSSLGCIDGLYKSMNDLNGYKYFMSSEIKNRLVDPFIAPQFKLSKHLFSINEPPVSQYCCVYPHCSFRESISFDKLSIMPYMDRVICSSDDDYQILKFVNPKSYTVSREGGYVKGPAVFMATDDLVVTTMTPISAMCLLDRLETPPNDLNEKSVTIGFNEGRSILKAALTSKSALTNGLGHLITQVKEEK